MATQRIGVVQAFALGGAAAVGFLTFKWVLPDPPRAEIAAQVPVIARESVPVVEASTPPTEAPTTAVADWPALRRESTDHFELARSLASRAIAGDARKQYVLSRVLFECESQVALTTAMQRGSLTANMQARLTQQPNVGRSDQERIRAELSRCERFFDGNPLAGVVSTPAEQTHEYWLERAVAAGEPLAIMHRATEAIVQSGLSDHVTLDEAGRRALLADVRIAIDSRDPDAVAGVGWLYTMPVLARDESLQGPAWLLAACELGYDCTAANPDIGQGCVETGACAVHATLADVYFRDYDSAQLGAIRVAADDILAKLERNDWDGLLPYLDTK